MKRAGIRLAQHYETAMRDYVKVGSQTGLPLARAVGKQAATLRLRALDLTRLHDHALAQFAPPVTRDGASHRADAFFAEVFTQLEQKSPSGRKTTSRLRQLNKKLRQRTIDLATSRRIRKRDLVDRNVLRGLKKKTALYASLLAESRDLQRCLQRLTRRMLSAQENERTTISRTLRDDVAQAMLGIQVKLAHLKTEAARSTTGLRKELTVTQRLVGKSAKTLEQFAGKLG